MEKLESKPENNPMEELADKLDALQREKNDGRGVDCVRTIIAFLRHGAAERAKAVCFNECDKIRSYPDIKVILEEELVGEKF